MTAFVDILAISGTDLEWAGALSPEVALLVTGLALLFGYGLFRLSELEVLARFRPYVLAGLLAAWGFAAVEAVFAISHALTSSWVSVGLFVLGALTITNLSWMRHVMAGLVLAFEGHLEVGDTLSLNGLDGEIDSFGLRAVRVQGSDGRYYDIPNQRLVDETLADLAERGDSMCELDIAVPAEVSVDRARKIARQAAAFSPYASPNHSPEIFIEAEDELRGETRLRVCGYAYHASRRNAYRSDVVERVLEGFEETG